MTKYLIYGVDGMSKPVVEMMSTNGNLPNIQKLKERESTVDGEWESYVSPTSNIDVPRTGPMWNSIYTGLKPKDHGYTLDGWKEGEAKFHRTYTLWDKLSENDISLALFDMPMTYRAKEINGWMISGFVATTLKSMFDNMLYPSDLIKDNDFIENTPTWIAKVEFDGIAPEIDEEKNQRVPMEGAEDWYETTRDAEYNKLEKFEELYNERQEPDVVAYGTTFADKIGHAASVNPTKELTRETYKDIDDILGQLIEIVEPEHVIIISDHGFSGWTHDLYGYYLNTTGEELLDVFEFTPFFLNEYGIDYDPDEYGIDGAVGDDLTEDAEERDRQGRKDALANLGYNPE